MTGVPVGGMDVTGVPVGGMDVTGVPVRCNHPFRFCMLSFFPPLFIFQLSFYVPSTSQIIVFPFLSAPSCFNSSLK